MSTLRTCAAIAVLLLAGACGDDASPSSSPSAKPSTTGAAETLVAAPGEIGPARAGMTLDEANATGLFEPFDEVADDPCADTNPPIQWKAPNTETHTLRVEDGTIASLGVRSGTKTAEGIGVDSTYGEVKAAYPEAKVEASQALGSTVYLKDGDAWLGLAFNEEPGEVKDSSAVTYLEVSVGSKPATFLSGCG